MRCFLPLPFAGEIQGQVVGHETLKRRSQVAADDLVVIDEQLGEDALVELATELGMVGARQVLGVGAAEQIQAGIKLGRDKVFADVVAVEGGFAGGSLGSDAGLFALKVAGIDGVGVEGVQELLPFGFQLGQAFSGVLAFGALLGQHDGDVFEHEGADLADAFRAEGDGGPVRGDEVFEVSGLDGSEGAAVLEALTAQAIEVVVEHAFAVAGLFEGQGFAAFAAVDTALQVVRVDAGLLAALVAGLTHGLDLGEQRLADQRLVFAVVLDAFEGHLADVVAVAQDGVEMRVGQRPCGLVGSLQRGDTLLVEFVAKRGDCPFAGGVALEQPRHPVGAVGVEYDGADLAAVFESLAGVEVAEGCFAGRAAILGLLPEPFLGFGGEVSGVELGDRAHDAVEQHARGCLVDVLGA